MQTGLPPEPSLKGVKFGYILEVISLLGGRDRLFNISGGKVCDRIFELYDRDTYHLSLVESELSTNLFAVVGTPEFIVSYATETSFLDVIDAVQLFLSKYFLDRDRDIGDVVVWIDVFSLPRNFFQSSLFETMSQFYADLFSTGTLERMLSVLHPWHAPTVLTRTGCLFEMFMCAFSECQLSVCMTPSETESFVKAANTYGSQAVDASAVLLHRLTHSGAHMSDVRDFVNNALQSNDNQLHHNLRDAVNIWMEINNYSEFAFDDYSDDPYIDRQPAFYAPTPVNFYETTVSLGRIYSQDAHFWLQHKLAEIVCQPFFTVGDVVEHIGAFLFSRCISSRLVVARALRKAIDISCGSHSIGLIDAFIIMLLIDKDSPFLRDIEDKLLFDDIASLDPLRLKALRFFMGASLCPACEKNHVSYTLCGDYSGVYSANSVVTWNSIRTCTSGSLEHLDSSNPHHTEFHFNLTTNRPRCVSALFVNGGSELPSFEYLLPLFSRYEVVFVGREGEHKAIVVLREMPPSVPPRHACLEPLPVGPTDGDNEDRFDRPQEYSKFAALRSAYEVR
jgi:hypothetical protein